jgi:diguanylate cyclase
MRRLAKKSTTDDLTKIPNRVAYNAAKRREAARQKRIRQPLVVAAFDIDYFKRINDQFGHLSGDLVLKRFGKLLVTKLRETDFVARYGGEEFVAIMPNTTIETAQSAINRLRELVEQCSVRAFGKTVRFTVSVGIAAQAVGENPDETFSRADAALYVAKKLGRNRVEIAA